MVRSNSLVFYYIFYKCFIYLLLLPSEDLLSFVCAMAKITFHCRRPPLPYLVHHQISPIIPQSTSQFAPLAYQSLEPQTHNWYSPNLLWAVIHYGRSASQSWIDGLSQIWFGHIDSHAGPERYWEFVRHQFCLLVMLVRIFARCWA